MALSEIDRSLLERCVARQTGSWNEFVDRFMGLVIHVIHHAVQARSLQITAADEEDLAAEVLLEIIANDFAVLRQFRGQSSLATYLAVIARRVVIRELLHRFGRGRPTAGDGEMAEVSDPSRAAQDVLSDREQVERLLEELEGAEADVVRLYHLEGKSYYEISMATGMPENSIGPLLSRAREKLRRSMAEKT
ncbi:MAG: sigma-70 family RNA polymerase sigma factor [Planctomycetales bacterium]|nr:sigma-70 family RNA polymerase sigma factor [Planctomycetales bacterium]NIM09814.1 sigma-70 family RNA polymerase sigma factor [Planctomycetales bacterium]NIN09283.1 sigma-70 family RNA polymerase sigma factor [Planctomycetales bacterium]NIN78386.1 sigma-70 family RNA polymerase sigma factor [Planctomycetales bacterium]NIO35564.1 sigma-70 family RNA polymerase sigma factor [Planctomycetales bacterium]